MIERSLPLVRLPERDCHAGGEHRVNGKHYDDRAGVSGLPFKPDPVLIYRKPDDVVPQLVRLRLHSQLGV